MNEKYCLQWVSLLIYYERQVHWIMKNKVLIVVDFQNDFITGTLGSAEAVSIVQTVVEKIKNCKAEGYQIYVTMDTHHENYKFTQEGKWLPVEHCREKEEGWQLHPEVRELLADCPVYKKETFGSTKLALDIRNQNPDSIELIGVCTDICVVSNALLLKAFLPEIPISVDSKCCAGVTPKKHKAALETMASCQIKII